MDVGTGVELECSYGAGDDRTRSRVASMPKERSGGPRLDRSCDWEKYGYDRHNQPSGTITILAQHCGRVNPVAQSTIQHIHHSSTVNSSAQSTIWHYHHCGTHCRKHRKVGPRVQNSPVGHKIVCLH